MIKEVFSSEETEKFAFEIAQKIKKGDIICLDGDLGTGKTVFTKGFARGLGITEYITSPTFTTINEYYSGRMPFYHFDVYRLESSDELYDIGYEQYFYGEGVCVVEWAEIIEDALPENAVRINIAKNLEKGEDYRRIEVKGL
jgi:tRNA threonylcarbamoyladenosine biosynthesis protein TsaE